MKKVSVIIPAYNKAEYTRRTVDSVLAQTYPDVEIVVVDDGSRDNTAAVMQQYGDRIRFIQKTNGGACSARNEGARRATGEYITFLDCDDLLVSGKIERCVQYLEQNPQFGFVYTNVYFIDDNDAVIRTYDHPRSKEGWIAPDLVIGNFICNSSPLIKKEVLDKAGLFDESIFTPADWDMWLRLSQLAPAGYIAEPLTKYRVTDNYTFNRLDLARKEEQYMLEKFFKQSTDAVLKRRAFSNFYLRFAQCAYIKNDPAGFWGDCKDALKTMPWNLKAYLLIGVALVAPGWLKKDLQRRILRRKDD